MKLIDKEKLIRLLEAKIRRYENERNTLKKNNDNAKELADRIRMCNEIIWELDYFKTNFKLKDSSLVWHEIDEVPQYNLNGISDFIISSAYGHIEGEAHTYTPVQWSAHIGFNQNRQFRWAYEKDLIDF